jgi:hypothetical protein
MKRIIDMQLMHKIPDQIPLYFLKRSLLFIPGMSAGLLTIKFYIIYMHTKSEWSFYTVYWDDHYTFHKNAIQSGTIFGKLNSLSLTWNKITPSTIHAINNHLEVTC